MHGHTTALGDSTDGITTAAGIMTHGISADGTIHGTTEVHGVSMTHGTMEDGTGVGIHTIHIMQDGTAASDGIRTTIIITTIIRAIFPAAHLTRITTGARDTRLVPKDLQPGEAAPSEVEQE